MTESTPKNMRISEVWRLAKKFVREMFPELAERVEFTELIVGEASCLRGIQQMDKMHISTNVFSLKEIGVVFIDPLTYLQIEGRKKDEVLEIFFQKLQKLGGIVIREFSREYGSEIKNEKDLIIYRGYEILSIPSHELFHMFDEKVDIPSTYYSLYSIQEISQNPLKILLVNEKEKDFDYSLSLRLNLVYQYFGLARLEPFELYFSQKDVSIFYKRIGSELYALAGETLFINKNFGVDVKKYLDAMSVYMLLSIFPRAFIGINVDRIDREKVAKKIILSSLEILYYLPYFLASRYLRTRIANNLDEFLREIREVNPEERISKSFIKTELNHLFSFVNRIVEKYRIVLPI